MEIPKYPNSQQSMSLSYKKVWYGWILWCCRFISSLSINHIKYTLIKKAIYTLGRITKIGNISN